MDYFKNLIWRIQEPAELNEIPHFLSEETISKIPTVNIPLESLVAESIKLNKTHTKSAKKKKTKNAKANNNNDLMSNKIPGYRELPKSSLASLTENEHEQCLIALKHLTSNYNLSNPPSMNIPMKIQNALKVYKTLEDKIKEEQVKYMEFVKDKWEMTGILNFKNIHSSATKILEHIWNSRLHRLNLYPQFYSNKNIMIPLHNECKTMEMFKISDLTSMGYIPYLDTSLREKYFLSFPSELSTSDNSKNDVKQDDLSEKLAKEHFTDVVIPLSSIKQMINLENLIWYIPISIKSCTTTVQGKSVVKKVIYFDKPLEHSNVNEFHKHKMIYKKVIKHSLCCNEGYKFPESYDAESEKNWSDNLKKNVIYSSWVLRPKDESLTLNSASTVLKNSTQTPVNIIVKSHVDACRILQNGSTQPLVLTPKIEYQLQFGAEVESKSDYTRNWISLFFHPFASLIKYYIDPKTSEIIMCQENTPTKISKDSIFHHNYNPVESLSSLYIILKSLQEKEVGDYLLCRLPKYGAFANLLTVSDETAATLDIHSLKTQISEEIPKWIPLDSTVILPNNESQNVLPGLFKWNVKKRVILKRNINTRQKNNKKIASNSKKRKQGKKKKKIGNT